MFIDLDLNLMNHIFQEINPLFFGFNLFEHRAFEVSPYDSGLSIYCNVSHFISDFINLIFFLIVNLANDLAILFIFSKYQLFISLILCNFFFFFFGLFASIPFILGLSLVISSHLVFFLLTFFSF
jgi:hypothetical protein